MERSHFKANHHLGGGFVVFDEVRFLQPAWVSRPAMQSIMVWLLPNVLEKVVCSAKLEFWLEVESPGESFIAVASQYGGA
jgi:hypothetical protein